jgi:hypothetical protein
VPTFGRTRFARLGKLIETITPGPLASEFPDSAASGMSWAVPMLAIMLPIGLCGFLQAARRPR